MESNSGKICRTSRFRWVRNRVKIASQDESWPGRQRQREDGETRCNFTFSNFLLDVSPSLQVIHSPRAVRRSSLECGDSGDCGGVLFKGPITKGIVKIDPGSRQYTHRAGQTVVQELTPSNSIRRSKGHQRRTKVPSPCFHLSMKSKCCFLKKISMIGTKEVKNTGQP